MGAHRRVAPLQRGLRAARTLVWLSALALAGTHLRKGCFAAADSLADAATEAWGSLQGASGCLQQRDAQRWRLHSLGSHATCTTCMHLQPCVSNLRGGVPSTPQDGGGSRGGTRSDAIGCNAL